jgi:hypothetical protein
MKLGAAIPVLNEWRFMPAVVGQLQRIVDRIVLVRSKRSQSGAPVTLSPLPSRMREVEVIEGEWSSEAGTRNAGLERLAECDYVFLIDSDEILLDDDLATLEGICRQGVHWVIGVPWATYWKTPEYRIDPPHPGGIGMVLRRGVKVRGIRQPTIPSVHMADVRCRHLGYVRTDDEMREKLRLATHSKEVPADWFDRVWKGWESTPSIEDLYPVPSQKGLFKRAVYDPDPNLNAVLERWGCQ